MLLAQCAEDGQSCHCLFSEGLQLSSGLEVGTYGSELST